MADQNKEPQAKSDTPPTVDPLAPVTASAKSAEPARKLDETVPGGRYLNANGQLVDANGEPLKERGK